MPYVAFSFADDCHFAIAAGLFSGEDNAVRAAEKAGPPNVVAIFCDDMAYADVGCFGGKTPTPNIDRLAKEGMRFTDFYVAQAVCSASRTAMLTGCLPNRLGILGCSGGGEDRHPRRRDDDRRGRQAA